MKALLKYIYIFSAAALMLGSCKKDETLTVATSGTPGTVSASSTNLVLVKSNALNKALTISWAKPEYGYNAAVKSILQISLKGNNFINKQEIIADANTLEKSFTVIDFNALMLKLSLPTAINSIIEVRIKSEISDNISPIYSNVLNITVNPYALTSFVYVPGDYQGWNPSTADSLISATSNGVYTGVINYNPGGSFQFKITPEKKWDTAYGDAGGGAISTSAGGNLTVPAAGSYKLTVDLNANTFAAVPLTWGVIGSATPGGWGSDTDMIYDNGKQIWTLTVNLTAGGEIKFRKNDDWGTNYGGSNGTLVSGGDNIAIATAGSYKITLDLIANTYTLTKL